jgi:hypothetical protein
VVTALIWPPATSALRPPAWSRSAGAKERTWLRQPATMMLVAIEPRIASPIAVPI